ncbi:MAG: PPC domain-containing protein [Polyangiaceae bacterium]
MSTVKHLRAGLFLLSLVATQGCAASDSETESDEASSDVRVGSRQGVITPGSNKYVRFVTGPLATVYSFTATKGQQVDFWVSTNDGDAVAYVLDAQTRELASNDDASSSTQNAHVSTRIPADGRYFVGFREKNGRPATFQIEFEQPPVGVGLADVLRGGKFLLEGASVPNMPVGTARVNIESYPQGYGGDRSVIAVASIRLGTGESDVVGLKLTRDGGTLAGTAFEDTYHKTSLSLTRSNGSVRFKVDLVDGVETHRVLVGNKVSRN